MTVNICGVMPCSLVYKYHVSAETSVSTSICVNETHSVYVLSLKGNAKFFTQTTSAMKVRVSENIINNSHYERELLPLCVFNEKLPFCTHRRFEWVS
jgi:hypothetical protein